MNDPMRYTQNYLPNLTFFTYGVFILNANTSNLGVKSRYAKVISALKTGTQTVNGEHWAKISLLY